MSQTIRLGRGGLKPEHDVMFSPAEIDILNGALDIVPELKICVEAVRRHRARKLQYPIVDHEGLSKLFDEAQLPIANHVISKDLIRQYVHQGLFPIADDQALMRAIYLALGACNEDLRWAQQAPSHGHQLLHELRKDLEVT